MRTATTHKILYFKLRSLEKPTQNCGHANDIKTNLRLQYELVLNFISVLIRERYFLTCPSEYIISDMYERVTLSYLSIYSKKKVIIDTHTSLERAQSVTFRATAR